jgi:hypothetical protein
MDGHLDLLSAASRLPAHAALLHRIALHACMRPMSFVQGTASGVSSASKLKLLHA